VDGLKPSAWSSAETIAEVSVGDGVLVVDGGVCGASEAGGNS
jgi:hypothetical protein